MSYFQRVVSIVGGLFIIIIAGDIPIWDYLDIPTYSSHILSRALVIIIGILLVYFGFKGKR